MTGPTDSGCGGTAHAVSAVAVSDAGLLAREVVRAVGAVCRACHECRRHLAGRGADDALRPRNFPLGPASAGGQSASTLVDSAALRSSPLVLHAGPHGDVRPVSLCLRMG